MTAYGASLEDPARAAALLRARASSAGIALAPASDLELVAAVLAAHALAVALADPLLRPHGPAASALAMAMARASGATSLPAPTCPSRDRLLRRQLRADLDGRQQACSTPSTLTSLAPVFSWARERAGAGALTAAAADLVAGAADPRIAGVAAAVLATDSVATCHF